jgi:alpha-1,6-mannosyltransferase
MSVQEPLGATESGAVPFTPEPHALPIANRARRRGTRAYAVSEPAAWLAIGGLILTTLVVVLATAQTDTLLPETLRPIPSFLTGPFGNPGIDLGDYGLIAVLGLMFVCYTVATGAAERLSARAVLLTIAVMHVLVLLAPPMLSTDIFSYQFYGRMSALYGANPYVAGPHGVMLDPLFSYIGSKWTYTPTVYGPLFTALSYLLAPLSIATSVFAYKGIAVLASLGTVTLVWHSARLRGINPVKAAALVGLNPLVVVYGVGGGHNDLLMMVLLMAGVYLILARRDRSGSAMIVVAAAVKLTAGVMLAFALAGGADGRTPERGRRNLALGAGAAATLLVGLSFLWFGSGPLHLFDTLQKVQSEGDWHSIPGFIGAVFNSTATGHVVGDVLGGLFVLACGWLLWRTWQGKLDWIDAGAWTALALLITASSLLPWYVVWLLPLAALATDPRLGRVAIAATGVVAALQLVGYLPHVALF